MLGISCVAYRQATFARPTNPIVPAVLDIGPKDGYNGNCLGCTVGVFPRDGALAAQPSTHRATSATGSPMQIGRARLFTCRASEETTKETFILGEQGGTAQDRPWDGVLECAVGISRFSTLNRKDERKCFSGNPLSCP